MNAAWLTVFLLAAAGRARDVPLLTVSAARSGKGGAFVRQALNVHGMLAVEVDSCDLIGDLIACAFAEHSESRSVELKDGSIRTTVAFESKSIPSSWKAESACARVSSAVDSATDVFLDAFDEAYPNVVSMLSMSAKGEYRSMRELSSHDEHLNHFHVYAASGRDLSNEDSLEMHTDQGLFVAIAPGVDLTSRKIDSSFFANRRGEKFVVEPRENSIVFLLGEGIKMIEGIKHVEPLEHSLKLQENSSRAWFGRMFFPPEDAFVDGEHSTFGELRIASLKKTPSENEHSSGLCGGPRRFLTDLTNGGMCDGITTIYCWMQCRSVEHLDCGHSGPKCINTDTNEEWHEHFGHNANYKPACVDFPDPLEGAFCNGNPTTMYMEGFTWVGNGHKACVALFYEKWKLDTAWKFALGMVGVFLFGIFAEYVASVRRNAKKHFRSLPPWRRHKVTRLALYGVQVTIGYLVMLLTMTFSYLVFAFVVLGVSAGHAIFSMHGDAGVAAESNSTSSIDDDCCMVGDAEDVVFQSPKSSITHSGAAPLGAA